MRRVLGYAIGAALSMMLTVSASAQKDEGAAAAKAKDWKKAEGLYLEVVAKSPSDGNSWFELGSAAAQAGDLKTAEDAFQHAVDLKARGPFAVYNLACVQAREGKSEQAFATLNLLSKTAPGFVSLVESDSDLSSLRQDARYSAVVKQMKMAVTPCEFDPFSRQFDFWIGDWDVFAPSGNQAGTSHVERSLNGCLLIENWEGRIGGSGKSFNTYNPGTKKWQQFWVASGGTVTSYEGALEDGAMRFVGTNYARGAAPAMVRLTFSQLEGGKVRQLGESTADGGKTWTVGYDFTYVKKK